ncbi:divalent-cation tolerance protein CutA [Rhabdochromatium marinum]|uniref:divalent-cation tolerance protein CutA n=1 Tax=Rhabdochromatium marinum TaxID=48729 RepID=UPI001907CC5E|nr:divalent-cation tolerance protein CutA [Rhabdochromatium marinum]MBK1649472.1 divalent-cation tolerance protein CutA [Rhabdochromatium marinum]
MAAPAHIVYCTCPDLDCAERIAALLVQEGLAACVTLLPGAKSFYHWEGNLCQDAEVLLMMKTTSARLPELQARLCQAHPYEVPELLAVAVSAGLDQYLEWIDTCTAKPLSPAPDTP